MYSNSFTRQNPGLILFLVDQSGSTEDKMANGFPIAQNITDLVNACISDCVNYATMLIGDDEEEVKREVCITVIGYGGKGNPNDFNDRWNHEAEILQMPIWVDEIESTFSKSRTVTKKLDVFEILKPQIGGGTPMASAFKTAYEIIKDSWLPTHQTAKDPVPVIINISDGEPTDDKDELKKIIEDIKSLQIPDGSPMIINIHLSSHDKQNAELANPSDINECKDEWSRLMFEVSTEVTDDMANNSRSINQMGISSGQRLFCSNIQDTAIAAKFIQIGTPAKGMR